MLLSAVSVLVVAQSSSEIPEGLMNNLVLPLLLFSHVSARYVKLQVQAYFYSAVFTSWVYAI